MQERRSLLRFIFMVLALSVLFSGIVAQTIPLPGGVGTAGTRVPAHYLVLQSDAAGSLNVLHYQAVTLAGPLTSLTDAELAVRQQRATTRQTAAVTVRLLDRAGQVVYQNVQPLDQWLRGEFMIDPNNPGLTGNGTNIDGHFIPLETSTFVVRVPDMGSGSRVEIASTGGTALVSLGLDALAQQFAGRAVAPRSDEIPGWDHGDPANRVDVLVMGDGYTSGQASKFATDAVSLANGWGTITPYSNYANYVNMRSLFTASAQSGADRPSCPSDPPDGGLDDNTFVNTAFDATFCSYGIWRLLTVDTGKVYTAAAAEPDWDHIFVVVNTTIYGGAGGSVAVVSTNEFAVDVLQHEYGHSFTGLADEYTTAYPGFPACSDLDVPTGNDCEANVTDVNTLANLKWDYWVQAGVPIPTTGPLADEQGAGLWEGARYLTTGMYRQCYACMMNYLDSPFGYVASEAYALRLYEGGWGTPANGIVLVEPGTLSPASTTVNLPLTASQVFSGQVLSPVIAPDAKVEWLLDAVEVSTGTYPPGAVADYTFHATEVGTFTLTMRVIDRSSIIHTSLRSALAQDFTWTINVADTGTVFPTDTPTDTPTDVPGIELLTNGSFESLGGNGNPDLSGWTLTLGTKDKAKCNNETKTVAYDGDCAFMFKGSVGENARLSQTVDLSGVSFAAGDALDVSVYTKAGATTNAKVKLKVKYSDATAPTKATLSVPASTVYTLVADSVDLTSDAVSSIKFRVQHRSTSGKVWVDAARLRLNTDGLRLPGN